MEKIRPYFSLLLGPMLFGALWAFNPLGLEPAQIKVLGVVGWMLIWWITECVPMAITSLLPVMLFPLLGVMSLEKGEEGPCITYAAEALWMHVVASKESRISFFIGSMVARKSLSLFNERDTVTGGGERVAFILSILT